MNDQNESTSFPGIGEPGKWYLPSADQDPNSATARILELSGGEAPRIYAVRNGGRPNESGSVWVLTEQGFIERCSIGAESTALIEATNLDLVRLDVTPRSVPSWGEYWYRPVLQHGPGVPYLYTWSGQTQPTPIDPNRIILIADLRTPRNFRISATEFGGAEPHLWTFEIRYDDNGFLPMRGKFSVDFRASRVTLSPRCWQIDSASYRAGGFCSVWDE